MSGQNWPTLLTAARVCLSLQKSPEMLTAGKAQLRMVGARVKGSEGRKGGHAGPPARDGGAHAFHKEPGLWDFCQLLASLMLKKEI